MNKTIEVQFSSSDRREKKEKKTCFYQDTCRLSRRQGNRRMSSFLLFACMSFVLLCLSSLLLLSLIIIIGLSVLVSSLLFVLLFLPSFSPLFCRFLELVLFRSSIIRQEINCFTRARQTARSHRQTDRSTKDKQIASCTYTRLFMYRNACPACVRVVQRCSLELFSMQSRTSIETYPRYNHRET